MRTVRLQTVRASVATTRCCFSEGVGPMSDVQRGTLLWDLSHDAFLMLPTPLSPKTQWQTDACKNITFSQLRLRVVTRVWTSVFQCDRFNLCQAQRSTKRDIESGLSLQESRFESFFDSERLWSAWVFLLFPLTHFLSIFRLNTRQKHKCSQNIAPWLWSGTTILMNGSLWKKG